MSAGESKTRMPELDHGPGFLDTARSLLSDAEPAWGDTYLLQPGNETYLKFLDFFGAELRGLPLDDQVGQTVLMRDDAHNVLDDLTEFIDEQIQLLRTDAQWDEKLSGKLDGLAEIGKMELFKNIILPEHELSGIGHSVDLGAVGSGSERRLSNVRIRRYAIENSPEGFSGVENGTLDLSVGSGDLYMELAEIPLQSLRDAL